MTTRFRLALARRRRTRTLLVHPSSDRDSQRQQADLAAIRARRIPNE
ncbi:hypothetical protein [Skermania piniformis]|uniref:Uncharacterized protein n=1 Tax=Skermania pinensis TaxID=39122 RepID=A0ABX8S736_9ACTN|nr:hypothetical protein [Skermania piniformis]QXQ13653.1 hypothetical protein KV203_17915 [Skermania piniformis]